MILSLRLQTGDTTPIRLVRDELDGVQSWRSDGEGPVILIRLNDRSEILQFDASDAIASTREEILDQFLDALSALARQHASGLADVGEESTTPNLPFPYDPESIRVETKPFNISLLYDMIMEGDINLSPDFQRRFVWSDLGARSRLIESIMLRIPLPVFYLAQDINGKFQVVDGLQRLTVIRQFLSNELRLRDLEYLKDEEGKTFRHDDPAKCIDQKYRKRILQTQVMMNIIDPQTPSDVKFDIFKRINQGGRPLNAQEIRNCMSTSEARNHIRDLCSSSAFLKATCGSVGIIRMQDQELILRFIAFRLSELGLLPTYQGNMERFLDQAIEVLNTNKSVHSHLARDFMQAMHNCEHLFEQFAFRKCLSADLLPNARRRLINNSLFTTWSVTLCSYSAEAAKRVTKGMFATLLARRLEDDRDLYDSVSVGTNDRRRLSYAFHATREICEGTLR